MNSLSFNTLLFATLLDTHILHYVESLTFTLYRYKHIFID